jgi:hypothetical protein
MVNGRQAQVNRARFGSLFRLEKDLIIPRGVVACVAVLQGVAVVLALGTQIITVLVHAHAIGPPRIGRQGLAL